MPVVDDIEDEDGKCSSQLQAGLDGRKAEINTNTYQYLHYFAAGIIVPHQFLMLLVLWPRLKTRAPKVLISH